jgi:hypothetical protein
VNRVSIVCVLFLGLALAVGEASALASGDVREAASLSP